MWVSIALGQSNEPVELDLEELFFHPPTGKKAMRSSRTNRRSSQFTGSDMTQATISIDPKTIWPESTTSHMKSAS